MFRYVIHRLLVMIPTLLVISLIVFVIIQLPPGDYLDSHDRRDWRAEGEKVDQAKIAFMREHYGFDKPILEQYAHWLFGMVQGDFGYSFEYRLPVSGRGWRPLVADLHDLVL